MKLEAQRYSVLRVTRRYGALSARVFNAWLDPEVADRMEEHPPAITRVMVEIAPLKKGCELKLTHENVPQDCASHIEGRWTGILYGLGVTLDSASTAFHDYQE